MKEFEKIISQLLQPYEALSVAFSDQTEKIILDCCISILKKRSDLLHKKIKDEEKK